MSSVIKSIKKHSRRLVKYAIVGTSGFFIDAGVLYTLTQYGHMWYILSEAFATLVAFVTNYAGNTLWTYRDAMRALKSPHSGKVDNSERKVEE